VSGFRNSNCQTDDNPEVWNLPVFPEKPSSSSLPSVLRSLTFDRSNQQKRTRKQSKLPMNNPNQRDEIGLKRRADELSVTYAVAPGWEP